MSEKGRVDEDLLGAEYVAGRELAALGGFWFEFAERLGQIGEQQSRWLMEDLELSAERLRENVAPAEVAMDHLSRQVGHWLEGASATAELFSSEAERAFAVHRRLWAPYLSLLSTDLRRAD